MKKFNLENGWKIEVREISENTYEVKTFEDGRFLMAENYEKSCFEWDYGIEL
jgi:hypothetical protein